MMYQQQNLLQPGYSQQPYQLNSPLQPQQYQNNNVWDMKRPLQVDGLDDAYRVQLPQGLEATFAYDTKRPIIYLIQINNGLNRTVTAFDYTQHVEQQSQPAQEDQVSLTETLNSINTRLAELEDKFNGTQSDSTGSQPKSGNSKYNKSGNGSNAGSH